MPTSRTPPPKSRNEGALLTPQGGHGALDMICPKCETPLARKARVQCSVCSRSFHASCAGFRPAELAGHRKDPDFKWVCSTCEIDENCSPTSLGSRSDFPIAEHTFEIPASIDPHDHHQFKMAAPSNINKSAGSSSALGKLEDKVDWLCSRISPLLEMSTQFTQLMQRMNECMELASEVKSLKGNIMEVHDKIRVLEKSSEYHAQTAEEAFAASKKAGETAENAHHIAARADARVQKLECALEVMEQLARKNDIVISGIPTSSSESDQSLRKDIVELANGMGVPLVEADIEMAHRLRRNVIQNGKQTTDRSNVLVKLTSKWKKMDLQAKSRETKPRASLIARYKTSATPIFINDHLTKRNGDIFHRLWRLKKDKIFAVRTSDCRIQVKLNKDVNWRDITSSTNMESLIPGWLSSDLPTSRK